MRESLPLGWEYTALKLVFAVLTGIYAFGDLTYDRACMLELAFPGELNSDRGGPEVELASPIKAAFVR